MGPRWQTRPGLALQSAVKWHTQRCHDSPKALSKGQGVVSGPNPGNLYPFPKTVEITLPLISIWNFNSVQSSSVWLFVTPWIAACQASLSITNSQSLLKLCLLTWGCHPIISSSVIPFSCLQSFPASGSFQMSQFFTSGSQSFWVSASASVFPMNI